MTCALDVEETAAEWERYRRRAGRLIAAGGVMLALALGFWTLLVDMGYSGAAAMPFAFGIVSVGAGLGSLVLARRMRRTLGAGVWSALPAVAAARTGHATTVVLRSPDGGEAWPLTVIATRQQYEMVRPGPDGVLWWCGDPRGGGVIAAPGGRPLIWAKPLRGGRVRRAIVAQAEAEGLMRRAAPRQPQEPLPVPVAVDDLYDPYDRIYAAPYDGPDADDNPADGSDDSPAHGPEPVHGPGPVTADGVPLGPRPERLDLPTYAVLAAHAQRQARPQGKALRPEADVSEVPWWRVRGLRRAAGVPPVLVAFGFCAAVGAVALTGPTGADALKLGAVGVLVLGALVYSCYRLLTVGLPAARVLARAAVSYPPHLRRYVLLFHPEGGAPVLVLFPALGGLHARPEAVLELVRPGPRKDPRRGLPALPVGVVRLHGWQDFAWYGRMPFVVPWIGGRPLWPAGTLWTDDGRPEFATLLERLAPPLES
ncbi:phage holin family protein [Streptomyces vietnamensis]|uniref:phage holin family protein n=1 Tax=Streptomyces vietnamensis TaxID=362257 RepID=UPI0034298824